MGHNVVWKKHRIGQKVDEKENTSTGNKVEWKKIPIMTKHKIGKMLTVEGLQSHFIFTMSHWSSRLPVCFLSQGTWVQIPRGVLMGNQDSPVSVVALHW